jgi:hypothetical protein
MDSSSSANYTESGGGWKQWNGGGYNGNQRYHEAGNGAATASWQLTDLSGGDYEVEATWVAGSAEALSAPWNIYDGNTLVASVFLNNTQAPLGSSINGRPFQPIATVHITSGILKIVVSETPTGQVAVDAVRVLSVSVVPSTVDLNWTNGGLSNLPTSVASQAPFTVNRTYTISGDNITSSFTIGYYASTDQTFGNSDDLLMGTETISAAADLAVGSHSGISSNLQINGPGTYYLFAKLDGLGNVRETDEINNVSPVSASVSVIAAPPPSGEIVFDEFNGSAGVRLQDHIPNLAPQNSAWLEIGGAEYRLSGNGTVQQQASAVDSNVGATALIDAGISDAFMVVNLRTPPAPFFSLVTGAKFRADEALRSYDLEFYRGTGVLGVYSKMPSTVFIDEAIEPFDMQADTDYTYKVWVKGSQIVAQVGTHILISDKADANILGTMFGLFEYRDSSRPASSVYKSFYLFPWDHEPLPDLGSRLVDTFAGNGTLSVHVPNKGTVGNAWSFLADMTVNSGSASTSIANNYGYFDCGQANVTISTTGRLGALDQNSYIGALGRKTTSGQYIEARFSGDGMLTLSEHGEANVVFDSKPWTPDTNPHTVELVLKSATYQETFQMYFDGQLVASYSRQLPWPSAPGETIQNATRHGFTIGNARDAITKVQVDPIRW